MHGLKSRKRQSCHIDLKTQLKEKFSHIAGGNSTCNHSSRSFPFSKTFLSTLSPHHQHFRNPLQFSKAHKRRKTLTTPSSPPLNHPQPPPPPHLTPSLSNVSITFRHDSLSINPAPLLTRRDARRRHRRGRRLNGAAFWCAGDGGGGFEDAGRDYAGAVRCRAGWGENRR